MPTKIKNSYQPKGRLANRIHRFRQHNPSPQIIEDMKYKEAINNFNDSMTVIEKTGFLDFTSGPPEKFYMLIDDLHGAYEINITLSAATDLTTNSNVPNIIQPTFNYNKDDGILDIYPGDGGYNNYELHFLLTASIGPHVSLLYELIYHTEK
jgi:hypothetical protein